MPRSSLEDPLKNFKFAIEIDGVVRVHFAECTTLERTTEVVEYNEGGGNDSPKKSAGRTNYGNITLKRGVIVLAAGSDDLVQWCRDVEDVASNGNNALVYRRKVDIIIKNRDGSEGLRVRAKEAWPCKYKLSDLNAGGNESWMEEIELCNEGWDFV